MAKNIQVAKIIASTTPTAWSQAYHAGTLTAIVAVTPKEQEDKTSLPIVGKDLLNTFEAEYFTLTNKNLTEIKKAVQTTYNKSSDTHHISFLVATAIRNTLYLVMAGNGSIFLLRKGKFGTLLEQETEDPIILSSSGFLEHGDIVVLASSAFLRLIPKEQLFTTLSDNSISEASEVLAPTIHAKTDGDAAAVFFQYEDDTDIRPHEMSLKELPKDEEVQQEETPQQQLHSESLQIVNHELPEETKKEEPIFSQPLIPKKKEPTFPRISHRRKLLITIFIALVVVLAATSILTIQRQQAMKNNALFQSIYPQAQQKYQDGVGLADLNQAEAHSDFMNAQQLLLPIQGKFSQSSSEGKQVATLLSQIQNYLSTTNNANAAVAQKVDPTTNDLLNFALSHSNISYFAEDASNIYTADNSGVSQIDKKSQTTKTIINNSSLWKQVGGFATYLGNFYVLDTKSGITKFVSSGSKFSPSNYFASGVNPDVSQAVSIAIDGSIWILESNGNILQYTRGKQVSFSISGLDTPFASPTQIVTSVDMNNLYILDRGNERIVVIDKTGAYKAQYVTGILKKATQLVVDEKNNVAQFLANGNVYQITLK